MPCKHLFVIALLLSSCMSDDSAPPPACPDLSTLPNLSCNSGGYCTSNDFVCCTDPVMGMPPDSRCER
jgi:hypothetical protein